MLRTVLGAPARARLRPPSASDTRAKLLGKGAIACGAPQPLHRMDAVVPLKAGGPPAPALPCLVPIRGPELHYLLQFSKPAPQQNRPGLHALLPRSPRRSAHLVGERTQPIEDTRQLRHLRLRDANTEVLPRYACRWSPVVRQDHRDATELHDLVKPVRRRSEAARAQNERAVAYLSKILDAGGFLVGVIPPTRGACDGDIAASEAVLEDTPPDSCRLRATKREKQPRRRRRVEEGTFGSRRNPRPPIRRTYPAPVNSAFPQRDVQTGHEDDGSVGEVIDEASVWKALDRLLC